MSKYKPCPCQSDSMYHKCCGPYHSGENPKSALELMRARFSAFALNNPDYIIDTTHEDNPEKIGDLNEWKKDLHNFSEKVNFDSLKIEEFIDGESTATVTFTAFLSQEGKDASFTEKSTFKKENGQWLYLKGDFQQPLHAVEKN